MNRKVWAVLMWLMLVATLGLQAQKMTTEEYIDQYKYIAIKEMLDYRIPASITLAQGILESGSGNSRLAREANNHFGIKCHSDWKGTEIYKDDDEKNECFRVYGNAGQSYRDHSLFLSTKSRYAFLFDYKITDYKAWAKGLKKAGYATNKKYPKLLIDLIERYHLDEYDHYDRERFAALLKANNRIVWEDVVVIPHDTIQPEEIDTVVEPGTASLYVPQRQIFYRNRVKYTLALPDDNMESLRREFGLFEWQIIKYNDLAPDAQINPGMIIYLQPKRRKGSVAKHQINPGESLWEISQRYAIKLSWLYKRNTLRAGEEPAPGTVLLLQGKKR